MSEIIPEPPSEAYMHPADLAILATCEAFNSRKFDLDEPLFLSREGMGTGWIQTIEYPDVLGHVIKYPEGLDRHGNDKNTYVFWFIHNDDGQETSFACAVIRHESLGTEVRPFEIADIPMWQKRIFSDCELQPVPEDYFLEPTEYYGYIHDILKYGQAFLNSPYTP